MMKGLLTIFLLLILIIGFAQETDQGQVSLRSVANGELPTWFAQLMKYYSDESKRETEGLEYVKRRLDSLKSIQPIIDRNYMLQGDEVKKMERVINWTQLDDPKSWFWTRKLGKYTEKEVYGAIIGITKANPDRSEEGKNYSVVIVDNDKNPTNITKDEKEEGESEEDSGGKGNSTVNQTATNDNPDISKLDSVTIKEIEKNGNSNNRFLPFINLFLIVVLVAIFFWYRHRDKRSKIEHNQASNERHKSVDELKSTIFILKEDVNLVKNELIVLKKAQENDSSRESYEKVKSQKVNLPEIHHSHSEEKFPSRVVDLSVSQPEPKKIIYVSVPSSEGEFEDKRYPSGSLEAFYQITLNSATSGDLSINENNQSAVGRLTTLDQTSVTDVCTIENPKDAGKRYLKTIQKGEVILENGVWKVMKLISAKYVD